MLHMQSTSYSPNSNSYSFCISQLDIPTICAVQVRRHFLGRWRDLGRTIWRHQLRFSEPGHVQLEGPSLSGSLGELGTGLEFGCELRHLETVEEGLSVGILHVFTVERASNHRRVPRNKKPQETHVYHSYCRNDLGELLAELPLVRHPGEGLLSQGPSP